MLLNGFVQIATHTLCLFHISEVRHFDGRLRHTKWWLWVLGSMWHETWSVYKRCVINSVMISLFIWSQWIFKFVYLILLHPVLSLHIKVTHHLEIPSLLLLYDCAAHWQKNGHYFMHCTVPYRYLNIVKQLLYINSFTLLLSKLNYI
jgi:uncharacterized membrane protein YhaH (DUF805 family)